MTTDSSAAVKALLSPLQRFVALESFGGILLFIAAILALAFSNSSLGPLYQQILHLPIAIKVGSLGFDESLHFWVNDLLMAVFFLIVGLEIKREILVGELSSFDRLLLPTVAALGGMAVPALIYAGINASDATALRGWAIPAATDIAFALGILLLLGRRIPPSLKVFLAAVAIIDDLGAIVVIAVFYTASLNFVMLGLAGATVLVLWLMNRWRVTNVLAYLLVGLVLWVFVLRSGIHATFAGVLTALMVPMRDDEGGSPLKTLEHGLHPWVSFAIVPIFAFANAGVYLMDASAKTLLESIPLGIVAGLILGKPIGVFGASALAIALGFARRPAGASWAQLFGAAVLCGIGFTMSLFIGDLAFGAAEGDYETRVKLGVLVGSFVSAIIGFVMLRYSGAPAETTAAAQT